MLQDSGNWHAHYMDFKRHWHPQSEMYAGGDCLLTALDNGWEPNDVAFYEEHWLAGTRLVRVYHFELKRGNETMIMPVISNPYVNRLVRNSGLRLRPLTERERARARR